MIHTFCTDNFLYIYTTLYTLSPKGNNKTFPGRGGEEIVVEALTWESGTRLRIGEPSGSLGRGKGGGAWKDTFDAAVTPITCHLNFNTSSSHHGCHRERIPKSIYCV